MDVSRFAAVLLLLIFFDGNYVCCYQTRSIGTRQVHGWKTAGSGYRTDTNVLEKISCITTCVSNTSCTAVYHHGQTCVYFDETSFSVVTDSSLDHSVVFVRGRIVLHAREPVVYSYTYPMAQEACTSLGGRLAYQSELQTVFENGYSYCQCGWLNGGNRMYLMQVSTNGCNNQVGLIGCNWAPLATAWCTFEP